MTNLFRRIAEQNSAFKVMVEEKGLSEVANQLNSYSKNSIIGIYSNLSENEKMSKLIIDELGRSYSVFAEITNAENGSTRFYHCGGSPIETVATELKKDIEEFFELFYK